MAALALVDYIHGPMTRDLDPIDRAICIEEKIADVGDMQARIEELEGELEDHKQLQEDFEEIEKERDELQKDLDERTKERDDIDGKLADAREEIERLTEERDRALDGRRDLDAINAAIEDDSKTKAALAKLIEAIDNAKIGKVARVGGLIIVEQTQKSMADHLGDVLKEAREAL